MNTFTEHDLVVLANDKSQEGLRSGDIGTIVHAYENPEKFEVEFSTASGNTVAVLNLDVNDIRPVNDSDIFHARLRRAS